jgi:large subunit ribosomal protein L21
MFAVIKTGGKQYKVQKDSVIVVEKLDGEAGSTVSFGEVLMAGGKVGTPFVEGASVSGEIVKQTRGEKIIVFKKIRRHGYKRKNGHKQHLTVVKITDIKA